mgnify:CR=1 FL=1
MGGTLIANVAVTDEQGVTVWYGPDFGNADQVPDEDAATIGAHAWAGGADEQTEFLSRLRALGFPLEALEIITERWDDVPDDERAEIIDADDEQLLYLLDDYRRSVAIEEPVDDSTINGTDAPPAGGDPSELEQLAVPTGSVKEILAWVNQGTDGWQRRANAAIAAETAGDHRKGILETLTDALRDDD